MGLAQTTHVVGSLWPAHPQLATAGPLHGHRSGSLPMVCLQSSQGSGVNAPSPQSAPIVDCWNRACPVLPSEHGGAPWAMLLVRNRRPIRVLIRGSVQVWSGRSCPIGRLSNSRPAQ